MLLSHLPKLHTHHHHHHHHRHLFLSLKPPKPSSLYQYRPTVLAIFSSLATSLPSQNPESLEDPLPQISKAIPQLEIEDEDPPQISVPIEKLFIPPETNVSGSSLTARILKGSNIVLSNYARNAQVVTAEYIKSSVKTEQCPSDGLPEFALVGRSNVGKSSLLNSIVRRKKLALTSKKPGKTQCINHFKINDSWYLVDLPGYGYAMAPQDLKKDWDAFTKDYFLNRSTLVSVFLLVDATIPVKKIDIEYASWLGQNQIPMTLIFTKCDKRKKKRHGGKRPEENVLEFTESIGKFFDKIPPWIMTSSLTNQGRDEILLHMAQLRNYWLKH